MISVLVNWAYVLITTYIVGYFTLSRLYRFYKYEHAIKLNASVAAGLAVTTVYAGLFSIVYKVGVLANLIMICACIVFVLIDRDYHREYLKSLVRCFKGNFRKMTGADDAILKERILIWCKVILFALFFVAALFYTTEGQFFSDSGYYHEQSIRWIEEFGTVKGSVHILKRLAYNSCYFCQCALFSMREIWGQSLHTLSGFYGIFVMGFAIFGFDKNIKINMLRIAPMMYFFLLCSEITSPASDYPLVFSVLYVVIKWFEMINEGDDEYAGYAALSLFVVFLISIKLTVGCLVLIVVKPAIKMIKEKKIKEIVVSIVSGVVILLPYFIRNYIICGWLIYPFTKIDIFNPDWKLSAHSVQADADEIKVWGRGMGKIGGEVTDSITTWLPHWWDYLTVPIRLIIISFAAVSVVYVLYRLACIVFMVVLRTKSSGNISLHNSDVKGGLFDKYLFEVMLILSLLYWIFESPLFRYGVAYILTALFYMLGDMLKSLFDKGLIAGIIMAVVCIICLIPLFKSLKEYATWNYECIRYYSDYTYFVRQEDYPRVAYGTTEIGGITFYYPEEELGQIGYHIFPSLWYSGTEGIQNRGDKITDGYKYKD